MRKQKLYSYLLGIIDAEGCFSISIKKQNTARYGWVIDPVFHVTQHKDARDVLEDLQKAFNAGRIIPKTGQENLLIFIVDNRRQLREKVLPFFERYPLRIKKNDYEIFKEVVEALENKEHQTEDGFRRLVKKARSFTRARKGRYKYTLSDILGTEE
jgi:hypothetical protein